MKKRLVIITAIFVFAFAVILNKLVNERDVQRLGQTFSEIYDDRLMVESYIYQLTELFYIKKIVLLHHKGAIYNASDKKEMLKQTSEITAAAQKYALTKLTENERQIFGELMANLERLKVAEAKLHLAEDVSARELERICELSLGQLKLLSSIQVSEGNLLKEHGRKVVYSSQLAGQLEWAVYFIILLIFVYVQRKSGVFRGIFQKYQLN